MHNQQSFKNGLEQLVWICYDKTSSYWLYQMTKKCSKLEHLCSNKLFETPGLDAPFGH